MSEWFLNGWFHLQYFSPNQFLISFVEGGVSSIDHVDPVGRLLESHGSIFIAIFIILLILLLCLPPFDALGEICEGLCTRGSCAFLYYVEGKVLRVVFGNRLADFPFCLVDPDPLLPLCLSASASYRSCANLYLIAGLRCVSGCCRRCGGSDRAPVLLGRPVPTSCPEVL